VSTGTDNAKMAVEWLMSKREAAGDVEPNLLAVSHKPLLKMNSVQQRK